MMQENRMLYYLKRPDELDKPFSDKFFSILENSVIDIKMTYIGMDLVLYIDKYDLDVVISYINAWDSLNNKLETAFLNPSEVSFMYLRSNSSRQLVISASIDNVIPLDIHYGYDGDTLAECRLEFSCSLNTSSIIWSIGEVLNNINNLKRGMGYVKVSEQVTK